MSGNSFKCSAVYQFQCIYQYEGPDNHRNLRPFPNKKCPAIPFNTLEYCLKCNSVYYAALSHIRDLCVCNPPKTSTQQQTPSRVVWVLGCYAYLVRLFLSLTGCLASPVSTSWTPSLTTCCPERGGVCRDVGQRKVGVCCWSPPLCLRTKPPFPWTQTHTHTYTHV